MPIDLLVKEAEGMSDDAIMEVVRFMRFIKIENNISGKSTSLKRKGLAGKYRGQGWMADDFDAPIDDFREYM
ncbi:MAG: DUF2281 domain-containing protein [Eubacterium sp.]|nr:DUF2281 domain-containing protein [Eubacterium sp.]